MVPLSAAGALGAVVATGNAVPREWYEVNLNTALRYVLPALYFPLFAGWALLPWRAGLFRVRPAVVVCALSVAAVLIAAPKAAAVRGDALDPFNTAFHQCFNDAAKRLGWRGGIGSVGFTHPLTADPGNDVEKMTPAGILRRGAGQSRFYLDWTVFNRHHFNGEFEFVVVNGFGGRALGAFPRAGVRGCELSDLGSCEPPQPAALILDEGSVRAAFGIRRRWWIARGWGCIITIRRLRWIFRGRRIRILRRWGGGGEGGGLTFWGKGCIMEFGRGGIGGLISAGFFSSCFVQHYQQEIQVMFTPEGIRKA